MPRIAHRVQQFGATIFSEMTALAQKHQAVNLGQGFPDFPAPDFIKQAAIEAITAEANQYAPRQGTAQLRHALAASITQHDGYTPDPDREITITHGATEAIFATIMGLVNPGDEVILFEPYFDSYVPAVQFAGGIPRYYTLRPPHWEIDFDELAALCNERTKMIIVNSPHNPTGKLFTQAELSQIAALCQQHDILAMMDAVYEHIRFDDQPHIPLATLPGMRERTIMISSVGKTFSVTGWKTGWAIAPPDLTQGILRAHQFITFATVTPMQLATAVALTHANETNYYQELRTNYQRKRDYLVTILAESGLNPLPPQGTYFVMADLSGLDFADDVSFCRYLTTEVGVTPIPPSAFYHNPADGAQLARFAFCKQDDVLAEAQRRLRRWARR